MKFAVWTAMIVAVALSDTAKAADLKVRVTGAAKPKGSVVVCLWRDGSGFPDCAKNAPLAKQVVPAAASVEVTFHGIAPGDYAVSAIHDANGNGKFDRDFMSIPTEWIGTSNNPKLGLGPPVFSAAVIKITGNSETMIRLNHY